MMVNEITIRTIARGCATIIGIVALIAILASTSPIVA
jgi:hypothetical protein